MPPSAQMHKSFSAGALFAVVENGVMLLQISEDFDVFRKEVDVLLDSKSYAANSPFKPSNPMIGEGRMWDLKSERQFDKVFETFFLPYRAPNEVRNRPAITSLAMVPVVMGRPLLPNDVGDHMRGM